MSQIGRIEFMAFFCLIMALPMMLLPDSAMERVLLAFSGSFFAASVWLSFPIPSWALRASREGGVFMAIPPLLWFSGALS